MSANNQQQEFRDLAGWVIAQAKKAGAGDCKVNLSKNRFVDISYRDRKPEVIKEAITKSLYLEVFVNNRYAAQSTPDFRKTTLSGFINDVIDSAKIMEEDPFRTLPDPKYYEGRTAMDLELCDPGYDQLTAEGRHEMAKAVESACLDRGGEKVISVEAAVHDQSWEEFIKTSNGFEGLTEGSYYQAGASMTAQDEGDRRPAGSNFVGCRYKSDMPSMEKVGAEAAERTLDLMGGKKIKTTTLPVIIENRNVGRVGSALLNALSGGSIQQKRSFLAEKKGEKIGSNLLTVVDDPFIPRALGSRYFDNDGFAAQKRTLFTEGVLNDFLINWYYSRKLGWDPTTGSTSNVILTPGTRSVDEIINDLDRCILITGFIGGNSNATTGDFSVGVIGKLFEKGRFAGNVAEMNIADNHLNFWNKLIEVANDPWIYSSARLPSLVFDNIVVAGI